MATASVTFRLDEGLKKRAESAFASMGLTMTAALNAFMRAVVREGRIPFSFVADDYAVKRESAEEALRDLSKFAGTLKRDVDIKSERMQWRDEKHADID